MTRNEENCRARYILKQNATKVANRLIKVALGEEKVTTVELRAMQTALNKVVADMRVVEPDTVNDTLMDLMTRIYKQSPGIRPFKDEERVEH